jgi:AraC family transcriptional regulator of adaptative response/methylated-DNA-[protein]-cysteine methyltransferase
VALLVPCHRVLATSGSLGGFRWGINRKQALLLAEGFEAGAASRRRNPMIGKTF